MATLWKTEIVIPATDATEETSLPTGDRTTAPIHSDRSGGLPTTTTSTAGTWATETGKTHIIHNSSERKWTRDLPWLACV